ncbi:MAG: GGDEF domain-containing protein [Nocardioides sp.]
MVLSDSAAQVMSRAQQGRVDDALTFAHELLASTDTAPVTEQSALWYAIAVAHHVESDCDGQIAASDRCLALARQAGSPGWGSNALSMRAMALVRQEAIDAALTDLARAEVELDVCDDDALACWAHTGLGYCYLELRLYELAQPHFEAALRLDASPMPLVEARVIDLMNLAELHVRWADELDRAVPYDGARAEADERRAVANGLAAEAVAEAERIGAVSLLASCRATELCSRPRDAEESPVPELREAYASPSHADYHGGRAAVGGALAGALWRSGARDEALAVAREAAAASEHAGDWQVAASARWLLVEMESAAGVPGAASGRDYARLLSRVLWRQRLSTLAGARSAHAVERLQHDKDAAQREALEDPLTGVGNRRALDDALRLAQLEESAESHPTSLLLLDLDAFKSINDRYGHMVGDTVLRKAAAAIRHAARADDTVARLGGDEFVVLARGTDAKAGARLAERVARAVNEIEVALPDGPLRLGASVGVRTTGGELDLTDLLEAADAAMYDIKRGFRPDVSP